ncbi:MraY family glycosyltransferase [Oceanospirillum sediminis]|uniref:Glycosyltransferase family 4 protein n=1 Tax=Oceanospirillum sediminis TaxID=2760088 RepID=A0A839IRX2_9GAMM|nr:glycosyltransferase family 4 protein [Oceanospirillum sediminis]MBB1488223.1 glycosyltransferase family 4 protein [Oceanospirillum sediminis]
MNETGFLIALILVFFVSYGLTGLIRQYALSKNLIDLPGGRSSHQVPTPRGGGVSVVVTVLLVLVLMSVWDGVPAFAWLPLLAGGSLTAITGFIDDHGHIPARWRLMAHFLAVLIAVVALSGLPEISLAGVTITPVLIMMLILPAMVWMLNLYNFMDGINGIAGIQAVTTAGGLAILFSLSSDDSVWILPAVISVSALGFLLWNFPTARIFMGDAGSGFLGITFATLVLISGKLNSELFWSALMLMAVFNTDATVTLIRRAWRKKALYEAHRSHAYQFAARTFNSHIRVSLGVAMINVFWLFPLALLVSQGKIADWAGLIAAYAPLIFLAWRYHAGAEEKQECSL